MLVVFALGIGGCITIVSVANVAVNNATTVQPPASTTTQAPVVKGPEPTCAYIGTDHILPYMQVELTFTNTHGDVNGLDVTYALLDGKGGTRFFDRKEDVGLAKANEKFRISVSTYEVLPPNINEATIGCRVLAIEEGIDIGGFQNSTDADTCTVLGADSSGRIEVDVAVTSPFKKTTKMQTWWALQAPGPVRFDTDTEVSDHVGAGESIRISAHPVTVPGWIGDGKVTCAVLGFWDQGP